VYKVYKEFRVKLALQELQDPKAKLAPQDPLALLAQTQLLLDLQGLKVFKARLALRAFRVFKERQDHRGQLAHRESRVLKVSKVKLV
jgi:hypothetical protein